MKSGEILEDVVEYRCISWAVRRPKTRDRQPVASSDMPGKIVNKGELAAILGRSERTIKIYQNEGMPFVAGARKIDGNEYDTQQVIDWLITREARGGYDKEAEQARLYREQTEIAKRRNAVESGQLVDVDKVILAVRRGLFGIRQKIVTAPIPRETKQAILSELYAMRTLDYATAPDDPDDSEAPEERPPTAPR